MNKIWIILKNEIDTNKRSCSLMIRAFICQMSMIIIQIDNSFAASYHLIYSYIHYSCKIYLSVCVQLIKVQLFSYLEKELFAVRTLMTGSCPDSETRPRTNVHNSDVAYLTHLMTHKTNETQRNESRQLGLVNIGQCSLFLS